MRFLVSPQSDIDSDALRLGDAMVNLVSQHARRHAKYGVMRAVWTDRELRRPLGDRWRFSASDACRLHARATHLPAS